MGILETRKTFQDSSICFPKPTIYIRAISAKIRLIHGIRTRLIKLFLSILTKNKFTAYIYIIELSLVVLHMLCSRPLNIDECIT